jgi:hypothetical protein
MTAVTKNKAGPTDEILALALEIAAAKRRGDHARCKRLLARLTAPPPGPPAPPPTLVSVQNLRETHGWTSKRVYALLHAEELDSVAMGGRRFIVLASVDAYVRRLLDAPKATSRPSPNPLAGRKRRQTRA